MGDKDARSGERYSRRAASMSQSDGVLVGVKSENVM
jgi:hypothetical protein